MSPAEIHITNLPGRGGRRLYYYQGNFFHPLELGGSDHGIVKRGIRDFMKTHRALVDADRADPDYKTLVQLAELEPA